MSDILSAMVASIPEWQDKLLALLTKVGAFCFYVLIGVAAKFGWMLVQGKKISKWYFIGSTIVACFIGYLSWLFCENNMPDKTGYIVPIATLCSDRIIMVLYAINWGNVIDVLLKRK